MSDQYSSNNQAQEFSLSMPSDYWLTRATRHKRRGDNRTAAALIRHALTLSPKDIDLRTEYALCLQALNCFESSNRECFDILARKPESLHCYSIIGHNMLALGRDQEAMDAYAHYLRLLKDAPDEAIVSEDSDDVEDMFDFAYRPRLKRYDCRMRLAARAMASGDRQKAGEQLDKAERLKYSDERIYTLRSILLSEEKQKKEALVCARKAASIAPRSVQALCALASAYHALGKQSSAYMALEKCVPLCEYAKEEQLVCFSAAELALMPVCLDMLRHNARLSPDRLPTLYNIAVALARMGKPDEAAGYIHRCRELDPEDLPTSYTFRLIEKMLDPERDSEALSKQISQLPFYPHLSPNETAECLSPLWRALDNDSGTFANTLIADSDVQRAFLYALSLQKLGLERLLSTLVDASDPVEAQALLRKVLVSPLTTEVSKRVASSLLLSMGAKPPFVVWHEGRISQLALSQSKKDDTPALRTLLIKMQRKWNSPQLLLCALWLIRAMSKDQRALVARDGMALWGQAIYAFTQLSTAAKRDPKQAIKEMKRLSLKHRVRSAVLALGDLYLRNEGYPWN